MEQLEQLLQLNIELEGLLRVAIDRASKGIADDDVNNIVIHKFNEFYDAFTAVYDDESEEEPKEATWHEITEEEADDESCTIVEEIEEEEPVEEETQQPQMPQQPPMPEPQMPQQPPMPEPQYVEQTPPPFAEPMTKTVMLDSDNMYAPIESEQMPPVYTPKEPEAKRDAKELSKSFTINDKYRFVRDLFNGNRGDFDITLERIASMSINEAQMYIIDELGWDVENPTVTEFMVIVNNFFNK